MNIKKLIGLLIISLSFLTTAIIIMMAYISHYIDSISGSYFISILKYVPKSIYFILAIPFIIGIHLAFSENILSIIKKLDE